MVRCQYTPAGNILGQYTANVPQVIRTAAQCTGASVIMGEHKSVCDDQALLFFVQNISEKIRGFKGPLFLATQKIEVEDFWHVFELISFCLK